VGLVDRTSIPATGLREVIAPAEELGYLPPGRCLFAGLAQLDRALASGAKGHRFESCIPR
jgi:hypothetical protein